MDRKGFRFRVPSENLKSKETSIEREPKTFHGLARHLGTFLDSLRIRDLSRVADRGKSFLGSLFDKKLNSDFSHLQEAIFEESATWETKPRRLDIKQCRRADVISLRDFLQTVYPILRIFTVYSKITNDLESKVHRGNLELSISTIMELRVRSALTEGIRINANDLLVDFFRLFEHEYAEKLDAKMRKVPMRKRRNLFAGLQKIHRYVESSTFNRWFKIAKESGEKNQTVLTCYTENYHQDTLCGQSELDHREFSQYRRALIVNNFLLFEELATPTCLAIRNAKSKEGGYFIEGMLYTMDEETEKVLRRELNKDRDRDIKECVIQNGNFTFVRALSYNELQTYREIIKRHRDVREKPVV